MQFPYCMGQYFMTVYYNSFIAIVCPTLKVKHSKFPDISNPLFGDEVTVYCDPGYHLGGADNFTTVCDSEGKWSNYCSACQRESL